MTNTDQPPSVISSDAARVHISLLEIFQRAVENGDNSAELQVKFFLSLATSILAAIVVLQRLESFDTNQLFWIVEISLLILFIFGYLTLGRINWGAVNSRKLWNLAFHAHTSIRALDPSFLPYLNSWKEMSDKESRSGWFLKRIQGSMQQFIIIAEAIIACGIIFNTLNFFNVSILINSIASLTAFFVVLFSLSFLSRRIISIIPKPSPGSPAAT